MMITKSSQAQKTKEEIWTDKHYPDTSLRRMISESADWSHDSKRILFMEPSLGDMYAYNLKNGKYKPHTHHYYPTGHVRALYLNN